MNSKKHIEKDLITLLALGEKMLPAGVEDHR